MCSHKYRHTGPTKPGPVFFSLLYKRQNSLNKGKQITPQVGMFITQVTWGYRQPDSNIYIHVSTQETVWNNSTLIKKFLKKTDSCIFLLIFRNSNGLWESFFWIEPWSKERGTSWSVWDHVWASWFNVTAENETNSLVCLLALIGSGMDTGRLHPAPLYR